jgi:TPP-dependent pyruvate/acetoin dehydrogenase alpha subunit
MNPKIKIKLYSKMVLIRTVEETIAERYDQQKMRCPTHLSTGQEAVSAAVGMALQKEDQAVSTHRSHGHYLGKGGNVSRMIAEIYGKEGGCSKGKGGSMHLIDLSVGFMGSTAIVGNSIPIGAGLALANKLDKSNHISCIFIGDGAIEEGVFAETVNFCAQKNLPVLFLCENNFYSVYSPISVRQPKKRKIYKMVESMGIPGFKGNGNDVFSVYKSVLETISIIKKGGGPRFMEFNTYRWREHCGPNYDNNIGYRTEDEFLEWKKKDPILFAEKKLLEQNILTHQLIHSINQLAKEEVDKAFQFAEESPFPKKKDAFKDVYAGVLI